MLEIEPDHKSHTVAVWRDTFTTRHIDSWVSFLLWLSHFILSGAIGNCPELFPSSILNTFWLGRVGAHLLVLCLFAFSYYSWDSHSKTTGVVCHSFLQSPMDLPDPGFEPGSPALQVDSWATELSGKPIQWTTFCQNSSLWSSILSGPAQHGS